MFGAGLLQPAYACYPLGRLQGGGTEWAFLGSWRRRCHLGLASQPVDHPHQQEDRKGNNEEVQHVIHKDSIIDGGAPAALASAREL